jgi:hypothetical protein
VVAIDAPGHGDRPRAADDELARAEAATPGRGRRHVEVPAGDDIACPDPGESVGADVPRRDPAVGGT